MTPSASSARTAPAARSVAGAGDGPNGRPRRGAPRGFRGGHGEMAVPVPHPLGLEPLADRLHPRPEVAEREAGVDVGNLDRGAVGRREAGLPRTITRVPGSRRRPGRRRSAQSAPGRRAGSPRAPGRSACRGRRTRRVRRRRISAARGAGAAPPRSRPRGSPSGDARSRRAIPARKPRSVTAAFAIPAAAAAASPASGGVGSTKLGWCGGSGSLMSQAKAKPARRRKDNAPRAATGTRPAARGGRRDGERADGMGGAARTRRPARLSRPLAPSVSGAGCRHPVGPPPG